MRRHGGHIISGYTTTSGLDPYRLLIDSITDYAICMLDPEGRVVSWNPGAQRFKGYLADEIVGQHFSRFYTQEDQAQDAPARALATALREGRFESEGWRVRRDGGRFWAHVIIDPILARGGGVIGFAKVTRDLTERKAAAEQLRQSEEQFRLLVQGVTDYAIYMLDTEGQVSSWNPGAERIKQYRPDEVIGSHFSRFYTPEDQAAGRPATALGTAREVGRFEAEGWRVRKDSSRFLAHVIIDAIKDDDGRVIGFAKITRDITERVESQKALAEARESLLQSQKLDAIGQLTGGIAHDFNNLLMAVLGSLEMLRKRMPDDPRALALLNNAVHGAERGAALTQRMLSFARKQELSLEAVDVAGLVRGMADLMQRSVGPMIHLTLRFAPDLPPVRTDANQLETALLNLVVNARDAMPGGGEIVIEASEVHLAAAPGLEAGDYVRLSVIDTGEGMDEETLSRAREPFYTTKGVGKGTGLGLSMAHGLAEQSGGRLDITSRLGEGVRVDVLLPRSREPVRSATSPTVTEPAAARPLRVLAVDDDGLVLLNTAAMLEDMGHRVTSAGSASEALRALAEQPFDVVITDYAMPRRTGLELSGDIAARWPDLPVILASGYAELPPGANRTLTRLAKPYTQAELARALCEVISAAAQATSR
ncbi:PAS domain-containing sensor histidine kinase [Caulobacter sp. NIBR1757]|uniref:hybrid sensor histidine kinase/response regulator n=1 Tax=Caulobacter sp. NIBR1757 TaxID=3016000 RepID=UPI0022F0AA7A|nr:PAS domain-containing sensor histidine kinase [Caulobacter sp. NIBR1757]WGM37698.1 Sensor histidine kinase RcsC [Caulobacter sp. NIBR1757]